MLIHNYANVILEPSLRTNEKFIDHNDLNLDKNEWIFSVNEQQKA